jgi:hypothetical protein
MAYGASLLDANGVPIGQGYKPGSGFAAIQASLITNTDGSSNTSAPITFHHSSGTVYLLASAAQTTTPFTSSAFVVGPFAELAVDINLTAKTGTSPTIQFFIDRIGADSVAYNIWSSSVISTTPTQVSTSIGSGFAVAQSFGASIQFRWTIGGSASPGYTFSCSIIGK